MKKSDEIRQKIAALTDEAQALHNVAEKENRDLTADESTRWTAIMAADTGDLAKAELELAGVVAHEQEVSRLRSLRLNQSAPQPEAGIPNTALANAQPQVFTRLRKLTAFKGENAEADAYASGMWLKSLKGYITGNRDETAEQWILSKRGWDIRATATEGSPSAGGYLTPTPLSNAVIDVREAVGVARQVCRVVAMNSNTLDVPHKTDGPTVYYPGEAGTVTASDQTWGSVSLTAVKRAIMSYVSQELIGDSIIPVMDDLASQMGMEFAWQEDNELINGDGTSTYGGETGLLTAIHASAVAQAATGLDTWPELTVASHSAAMGKLDAKWLTDPSKLAWICSAQYYTQVMERLMMEAGGNQIDQLKGGASGQRMFAGAPVYVTSKMPTSAAAATVCALYGNFYQSVLLGDRQEVRVAMSDQFAFDTDRVALRGTTRYDINVYLSGASGPYVAVKTAA